jgi:hypothetical protein
MDDFYPSDYCSDEDCCHGISESDEEGEEEEEVGVEI